MDIHKPKPWHGVREFLKEYVIIVVGVLTALGAEQAAEWLHWRHETEVAREAVRYDLRRALGWAGSEAAEGPCKARQLAAYRLALDQAQATHRLPPLAWPGGPGTHAWNMRSWSALTSGGALAHMPNREQLIVSAIATNIQVILPFQVREDFAWAQLENMTGSGRPTSDAEIAALRASRSEAAFSAMAERNNSASLATLVLRSGLLTKPEVDKAWSEGFEEGGKLSFCRPTPTGRVVPLEENLAFPAQRPGQGIADTTGVAGAISTER